MRDKALTILEFDKIREQVASLTSTPMGATLARRVRPSPNLRRIRQWHQETAEAQVLLGQGVQLPLSNALDIRGPLHRSTKGGDLTGQEFLAVQSTLQAMRLTRRSLERRSQSIPVLVISASGLSSLPELEKTISRIINIDGTVLDEASPSLHRWRQQGRRLHQQLLKKLNHLLASQSLSHTIQEPVVTQRGGRYVIPVKAEHRGNLPGIIHDVSGSGATVFVEPLAITELGNMSREIRHQETKEVERILRQLSRSLGDHAENLLDALDALARIDLAFARASYGQKIKGILPKLPQDSRDQTFRLLDAEHPLLAKPVVPISIELGEDITALVITGPNTGGKTVSLKTVGLLSMMSQTGIPIPANIESHLPIYEDIYVDIGDEQSIQQSLSTFSSHIANIEFILRRANPRSLVLLDELGAGTDPDEGSALAQAILSYLLQKKIPTIATTHHGDLKAFAQTTDGVQNGRVEFDGETLAPTYQLTLGLPGRSNALAIAARLGLPGEILGWARANLGPDRVAADALLNHLQEQERLIVAKTNELESLRHETQQLHASLEAELGSMAQERAQARENVRREFLDETKTLRARLARLRAPPSLPTNSSH